MRPSLILLAALCFAPSGGMAGEIGVPTFVEEARQAGIGSFYAGDWEYMAGGGAAAFDCDGNGYPDLYLAGGESQAHFYRNASTRGGPLKFVAAQSGLEFEQVTGAYPIDIDSDGIMDLVVLRVGENLVMRGKGDCKFERANEAWGFDGGDGWSTAFAATWEGGSRWPVLAIGNYIDRYEEISPWGSCTDNWLHRPDASGQKFAPPLALKPSFCALSMLFTDWNRSGTPSLRVSNDREYYEGGQEQMWKIEAGKVPLLYGEAEGWKYLRIWGMGIASADLDGDFYPEYFLTSMADNKLQALDNPNRDGNPKPSYKDVAFAKGITAHRPYEGGDLRPSTAWHTEFEDVNNDGRLDLLIVKGNVAKMPDFAAKDPNNLLLQGEDGKFVEAGGKAGIASFAVGRGGALADFNLDGLLDLVVVNRWENVKLWRNTSEKSGHWLALQIEQEGPNRNAANAWIEVNAGGRLLRREITIGGGHASGKAGWIHIGLGEAGGAEFRVKWPDGEWSGTYHLRGDSFAVVTRGQTEAQYWEPTP